MCRYLHTAKASSCFVDVFVFVLFWLFICCLVFFKGNFTFLSIKSMHPNTGLLYVKHYTSHQHLLRNVQLTTTTKH